MKKAFLSILFLLSVGFAFGQSQAGDPAINGAYFTPTTISGCGAKLSAAFSILNAGTIAPVGGVTVYIAGPVGATRPYTFQSVQPTGNGASVMNWTFDAANNAWVGVNNQVLNNGTQYQVDFLVDGTTVNASPTATDVGILVNVSWVQAANNTANDGVSPTASVSAVCSSNIITITNPTPSGTAGTTEVLTANGCTGGTITWTPGGATGNTLTVTYPATGTSTTYTATCSTGGTPATTTVTGTTAACAAAAGTLN